MLISHKPIEDSVIASRMFELLQEVTADQVSLAAWHTSIYTDAVTNWIQDHPLNTVTGLDQLPHRAYSSGSVDSINSFVARHGRHCRLRFSQAEFVAAKIVCNAAGYSWCFLEDDSIKEGDAVVMSMPFAGTGNAWPGFNDLIAQCNQHQVPVFLDLSYWPISQGLRLDLSQPCIVEAVFSLSKPIATQLRLGMRLTRSAVDDMLQVNSDLKIYNRVAAWTGVKLINEFNIDWLLSKYLYRQTEVCASLGLEPSATFTLAQGDPETHQEFNRNGYNRICITDEITEF